MELALAALLSIVFLVSLLLDKTLEGIPAKELRRIARASRGKKSAALYKLSAYGASSKLFLLLLGTLSASGMIWMAFNLGTWPGILAFLTIAWLIWLTRPRVQVKGALWALAGLSAQLINPAVALLQPMLMRVAGQKIKPSPKKLYETEDLIDFLKRQRRQMDNRMPEADLKTAINSLTFSSKTVSQIMIPRSKVKWVTASDPVGPLVMDELHQSGQSCFGVVKETVRSGNPEVIGVLYLNDLLENLDKGGRIRDIMQPRVTYINETETMREATDIFLKSNTHILVVINNFEEVAGVLTLSDTLKQIFSVMAQSDKEPHNDIRDAAGSESPSADSHQSKREVE